MKILFICMGNICRSPTAEGVFRHKVRAVGLIDYIAIDSAGTHNYHPGEPPDARSQHHALRRGYDLSGLRARALREADIESTDFLVAMDDLNYSTVRSRMGDEHQHKLRRLTESCLMRTHKSVREVPDPYYGERADFERVLDLVEDVCSGLLAHVRLAIGRETQPGLAQGHHRLPADYALQIRPTILASGCYSFSMEATRIRG